MTAEQWASAVRHRLGLGRLLPLGGPRDGAWISEAAAEAVLRRAARDLLGLRLGTLRIGLADAEEAAEPVVPAPPGALPPGPLRITADFAATAFEPLPATADLLRTTLASAATELLGLAVREVDLRVTALLEEEPEPTPPAPSPEPRPATEPGGGEETLAAAAVLAVPGVSHLTNGLGRAGHLTERQEEGALPHRHARVELAVDADHRTLDVARQVRTAVAEALLYHPTVTVLVTAVG